MNGLFHRAVAIAWLLLLAHSCSAVRSDLAPGKPERPGSGEGTVVVRLTFREAPLPGARVLWSRSPAPGEAPVAAGATGGDGAATFRLAPGRYFLVAQWRKDGDHARAIAPGDRFAYFGGNPVYVARNSSAEIYLGVEEFAGPRETGPAPAGAAGVTGLVLCAGAPVPDVQVSAYLRPEGGFRDLGFAASSPTDDGGRFILDLPPGRYYLVARKRAAGSVAGPMRKGDAFGYYAANPVTVDASRLTPVVIPVTLLKLRNAPSYSGAYAATAVIEGRILGRDGKPRRGVYAALYDNPELLNRPVFLSDVTGNDGRYRLPVPAPGTYFLGARNGYGGSPAPGDFYGRFEKTPDHSLTLRDGDRLTGIDIVVDEVR